MSAEADPVGLSDTAETSISRAEADVHASQAVIDEILRQDSVSPADLLRFIDAHTVVDNADVERRAGGRLLVLSGEVVVSPALTLPVTINRFPESGDKSVVSVAAVIEAYKGIHRHVVILTMQRGEVHLHEGLQAHEGARAHTRFRRIDPNEQIQHQTAHLVKSYHEIVPASRVA